MVNIILLLVLVTLFAVVTVQGGKKGTLLDFDFTNAVRGIAMLLIVIGHISGTMGTVVFSPIACVGVSLFLFVSGYGLNESYKNGGG